MAGPDGATHVVAGTPWAGSRMLCNLMGRTGAMATPLTWFDPLSVPVRVRELEVESDARPWAVRYIEAVRRHATVEGTCTLSVMWSHQRWLLRIARLALDADPGTPAMLDPEVVAASFPNPSYVWVRCGDAAAQALRWYAGRHPRLARQVLTARDDLSVDFQEVRWLETLAVRQDTAWATYFAIHGIIPVEVSYEDLIADGEREALAVVRRLGYEPAAPLPPPPPAPSLEEGIEESVADRLAAPYRRARSHLSRAVGVRARNA